MKILMVNKFHYIKGGSETYYFALRKKLVEEGHVVIDFSMKDERNFDSPYSSYFVEKVDYMSQLSFLDKVKIAKRIIYSTEAKRKFEDLVLRERPDIVHLHIFQHQISPSILDICKKYRIPTVYTAHDLKMVCLNYKMMHHGNICEDCKGGRFLYCAKNKCVKDSFVKSMINVCEGYFHKWRKTYDVIDYIITPSFFYKRKFIEFGVPSNRLVHIPNFLEREQPIVNEKSDNEKYFLYFGRLSEEKGILTLIKAMRNIDFNLYIVGTGPLEKQIELYINEHDMKNISLLGFKSGQELIDFVGNAKAVVIPSEWYENGPYSAIEALQLGRPLIGANIGGIPELIDENGYLFSSTKCEELHEILTEILYLGKEEYMSLKRASYGKFVNEYVWEKHYRKILNVYNGALKSKEIR